MPASVALVAALFFIFVFLYMVRSVHGALTPSIATEVVRMGDMNEQRSAQGMIVRYEEVIYATRAGRVEWLVDDEERVRYDTLVARVVEEDAISRINRELRSAEDELMQLNSRRHFAESDSSVQRINNNLQGAINNNIHNFSTLNFSELNAFHERLLQQIENRNRVILDDGIGAVGEAGRHVENLWMQFAMNSTNVYASSSGIMSPIIDWYETTVTPTNMMDLSRAAIAFPVDHTALIPARYVEAGDPIFKVVRNIWYIVAHMPNDMVQGFTEGSDRTIFIQNAVTGNYEPITMRIVHFEPFHTDSMVIFRSNRNVIDFLNQRNISIRTTDYVSRGLKVSTSAIATRRYIRIPTTHIHGHGTYFVHLPTDYGLRQVPINISEWAEDYVYIVLDDETGLIMGDRLISADLLGDAYMLTDAAVRNVHGVYGAAWGYASFIPVNLDGELSDVEGYTLLDPVRNPSLREFFTIVTDASSVTHGQIIR